VNLREQQDAVEFFMSLFESLDEGLKALGQPQLMNATLGGSFSDQKICQECPHRYSKEAADSKAQLNELIHELIDDFLFTASREFLHLRRHGSLRQDTVPPPVCRSPHTIAAACDLLIALCQLCVPNMKLLTNTLIDFVCTGKLPLRNILRPI